MRNNNTENKEEKKFLAAISLLGESTKKGYDRVQKDIMTDFGISPKDMPSYHMMTKFHPNFTSFDVSPLESLLKFECDMT